MPSTTGNYSITASGVLNGAQITSSPDSITVVSPLPTIAVTAPVPQTGYIYSNNAAVVFSGQANVSIGYPSTATVNSIGYKIGSNAWQTASVAHLNTATWSVAVTLPVGLSTIEFNASDSNSPKNTAVSSTYTVVVDTSSPVITWTTGSGATTNATSPLTAKIVDSEGDLNASSVSVTYNGTALPSSDVTVTGTNSPGTSVTYTVTAVLPGGHWTVQIAATNLAGNSASSATLNIFETISTTSSFVVTGSVVQTTLAGNKDTVTGTYVNNLPGTQTITVVGGAYNTAGQEVAIATGTVTISTLGQQTFNLSFIGLTPGQTYTIKFYAVSSAGVVGSVTSTATVNAA
jgi:hypothetical protein